MSMSGSERGDVKDYGNAYHQPHFRNRRIWQIKGKAGGKHGLLRRAVSMDRVASRMANVLVGNKDSEAGWNSA